MMNNRLLSRLLLLVVCTVLAMQPIHAAGSDTDELEREMYRLFYTDDSLAFRNVTGRLKQACEAGGNEQLMYRAWSNEAIFEATHQRRTHALEIAREMEEHAQKQNSVFGQYTAIHVMGVIYHQMRDYHQAEATFKKAIAFLRKHAPEQSAAADYIELMLISVNGYNNVDQGLAYAVEALDEPNLSVQHRLRVLTMLCQVEGEKPDPDPDTFNKYYEERLQVKQVTAADRADHAVELLYHFVNGRYDRALELSDSLSSIDQGLFEKARIMHKLGKDNEAYLHMLRYKSVRDSMNRAERFGLLSEYITQLNNERLSHQNLKLEKQNARLRNWFVLTLIVLVIILIVMSGTYVVRKLRHQNKQLGKAHEEERHARMAEETARKEAEMELDVKREFLNNVAQELRSPLNPITGFSDILADENISLQPEEREMMSQHIRENSKRLTGIIDNMIELSFYESKTSLQKGDVVSPFVVCQNAVDYARIHWLKDKPEIEVAFRSDLPEDLTIKSDYQGVNRVVRELMLNAAKFTEKGGILLNLMETKDGKVRFMVTDTGPGIDPERIEHIFHPNVQKGHDVKMTGMGLAICNHIAKLLNCTLSFDEKYKKGSRFIFDVPKE